MTVDMAKARVGDALVLRCGGRVEIAEIPAKFIYCFRDYRATTYSYRSDGKYSKSNLPLLDVVAIEPRPLPAEERPAEIRKAVLANEAYAPSRLWRQVLGRAGDAS
jgi:hypothetical protein